MALIQWRIGFVVFFLYRGHAVTSEVLRNVTSERGEKQDFLTLR